MNANYLSIKPAIREQAQAIADKRSVTFKNWQAVIRLAVNYGLEKIRQDQFICDAAIFRQQQNTMREERELLAKRRQALPVVARTCPVSERRTSCNALCRECEPWLKKFENKT